MAWSEFYKSPGHSVYFRNKNGKIYNTWDTWHLFPKTRPYIAPAEPKLKIEDSAALKDNVIDYSDTLSVTSDDSYNGSGGNYFKDREGSWEFKFIETYENAWKDVYYDLYKTLNGQYFDFIALEDDLSYHYKGRITIESWDNDQQDTNVTIHYRLNPIEIRSTYTITIHHQDTDTNETVGGVRAIDWINGHGYVRKNDGSTIVVDDPSDILKGITYYIGSSEVGDWLWNDLFNNRIYYGNFDVKGSKWRTLLQAADGVYYASAECENTMTVESSYFGSIVLASGYNRNRIPLEIGKDTLVHFIGNGHVKLDYLIKEE